MGEGAKSTYIISNTHGFRILVYQPVNNISEKRIRVILLFIASGNINQIETRRKVLNVAISHKIKIIKLIDEKVG